MVINEIQTLHHKPTCIEAVVRGQSVVRGMRQATNLPHELPAYSICSLFPLIPLLGLTSHRHPHHREVVLVYNGVPPYYPLHFLSNN